MVAYAWLLAICNAMSLKYNFGNNKQLKLSLKAVSIIGKIMRTVKRIMLTFMSILARLEPIMLA